MRSSMLGVKLQKKFNVGDLIITQLSRTYPISLRSGPGYTFHIAERFDPKDIGLVLRCEIGHGAAPWIMILVLPRQCIGWLPESVVLPVNEDDA